MCAIYCFLRRLDDLADEPAEEDRLRADRFAPCRAILGFAFDADGCGSRDPIAPAFADTVRRFGLPREDFEEAIRGAEMDLEKKRYGTFQELRLYCHRAASVVGRMCLHIFGHSGSRALALADELGVAFQLTNILRDLREDAARGRLYIPAEDLARFGVEERELLETPVTERVRRLLAFESERAREALREERAARPNGRREEPADIVGNARHVPRAAAEDRGAGLRRRVGPRAALDVREAEDRAPRVSALGVSGGAPPVVVVGGGLAGIAAAAELARAGHRTQLHERRRALGGRASSFRDPVEKRLVDNGQHVLLGACAELRGLMDFLGVGDRIAWRDQYHLWCPLAGASEGVRATLRPAAWLPSRIRYLPSLLGLRILGFSERLAVARGLAAIARLSEAELAALDGETFEMWLRRHGQPPRAVSRFWAPVIVSALNESIDRASARAAAWIFLRGFLGSPDDVKLGIPARRSASSSTPLPKKSSARSAWSYRWDRRWSRSPSRRGAPRVRSLVGASSRPRP